MKYRSAEQLALQTVQQASRTAASMQNDDHLPASQFFFSARAHFQGRDASSRHALRCPPAALAAEHPKMAAPSKIAVSDPFPERRAWKTPYQRVEVTLERTPRRAHASRRQPCLFTLPLNSSQCRGEKSSKQYRRLIYKFITIRNCRTSKI